MPAKPNDFTRTEIKAGVFVLVSAVIFILFVGSILNWQPPTDSKKYYAFFSNTSGLKVGTDVRFGGIKSGRVSAIEPAPGRQSKIRVTAEVELDTPVNAESMAYVTQLSLTSDFHLEISTGSDDAALLDSEAELVSGAGGLFGQVEVLAENVNQLLSDLTVMIGVSDDKGSPTMSDEEQQTIAELFVGVESLMGDLQTLLGVTDDAGNPVATDAETITVANLLTDIDETVVGGGDLVQDLRGVVDEVQPGVERVMNTAEDVLNKAGDVATAAEDLVKDMDKLLADNLENVEDSLESMQTALGSVEGLVGDLRGTVRSLDALIVDNEPALEDILINLRQTMHNLEELTSTLSDQPQSIIRGRTPVGRQ